MVGGIQKVMFLPELIRLILSIRGSKKRFQRRDAFRLFRGSFIHSKAIVIPEAG
jgi:hypothetical protein